MAENAEGSRGRSVLGLLLLLIALALAIYVWLMDGGGGGGVGAVPTLDRPMVADVTGHDQGDAARPYPIRVYLNPDSSGAIVMDYRDRQYSQRFQYAVRASEAEQVSVVFQAQLYGTDQMPPGENYFLTLDRGGQAVLVWHDRSAAGRWAFATP